MQIHCFLFLAQFANLAFSFVNTASFSSFSSSRLLGAPEVLAEEGPWQAYLDEETTGLIYYFDSSTGESLWEPPTDTFPKVDLPRKKQRLADDLRREYRQTIETEDSSETNDSNWFSGIFDSPRVTSESKEESAVVESEETAQVPWSFGGITSGLQQEEAPTEEAVEEPASAPWSFGGITAGFQQEKARTEKVVGKAAPSEPKKAPAPWLGSIFGDSTAKEEKTQEMPVAAKEKTTTKKPVVSKEKKVQKKPVTKKEDQSSKNFGIFSGMKASGKTVVAKEESNAQQPRAAKKKDPKIAEPVRVKAVAKKREPTIEVTRTEPIKIEIASNILPHPAKVRWGGEDAVFTKGRNFGVFDGVSGAEKKDGVPLYSRTLANEMKKRVGNEGLNVQEMTKFLTEAADVADAFATGASTAVVASIGENGFLQALNVGDSCCMVVRDGMVAAKTREISHYWECPYQLSSDSPDRPKDGTKLNVELTSGDIIIMGSDGIFDNVSDDMILDTVGTGKDKASQIAKKICNVSRKQSLDKESVTPYSKQAQRRGIPDYQFGIGGKVDDIGCVVVVCK
jgi:protein phosphatase PTC7